VTARESEHARPLPSTEGLAGEFYDWCRQHELRFQRCTGCGAWRHVPREMCAACGSFEWEWARSSGQGTVYTWTVVVRALHAAFQDDAPYAPVVVQMAEGVRVLATVVDCPPEELEIGMPVTVVFDDVTPDATLPRFRRVRDRDGNHPPAE
jgi:uncharacterized OB-fold protein